MNLKKVLNNNGHAIIDIYLHQGRLSSGLTSSLLLLRSKKSIRPKLFTQATCRALHVNSVFAAVQYRAKSNISPLTVSPRPELCPALCLGNNKRRKAQVRPLRAQNRRPDQTVRPSVTLEQSLCSYSGSGLRLGSPLTSRSFTPGSCYFKPGGRSYSAKVTTTIPTFFNFTFDKGRLKNLVSWTLEHYGQYKTIELLEQLKKTGFEYATKAGISLGIDDLKIPPKKKTLLLEAEKLTKLTVHQYQRADITAVERFQRLIDTWHRTSEQLKQEVITYFEETDILNPVYMMAFSGARGNISQVRQLVGMRGLMSDPQGQIIDFPIRSNFREGLTLTEYIISSYGARKGIVDTALRTANAGYLTRRLVDVAQHVIISYYDCGTQNGIFLTDMKEGNKTLVSAQTRILGRVLARDILQPNTTIKIAKRNQEITSDLAFEITKITNKIFVRSSLTCNTNKLLCQLCYGWSLAQGNLVSVGEAVGVIAAQSIGEPGTQLTMRTFHTGGVFSGDVSDEIRAPYNGFVHYDHIIPGILIRTIDGKIRFLTKADGTLIFSLHPKLDFLIGINQTGPNPFEQSELSFDNKKSLSQTNKADRAQSKKKTVTDQTITNLSKITSDIRKFKIPAYTILFMRNGESVIQKQVVAQITSVASKPNMRDTAELIIKSELEGLFYSKKLQVQKSIIGPKPKNVGESKQNMLIDPKAMEIVVKARGWNFAWVLAGKRYEMPLLLKSFPGIGDYINQQTIMTRHNLKVPTMYSVDAYFDPNSAPYYANLSSASHSAQGSGPGLKPEQSAVWLPERCSGSGCHSAVTFAQHKNSHAGQNSSSLAGPNAGQSSSLYSVFTRAMQRAKKHKIKKFLLLKMVSHKIKRSRHNIKISFQYSKMLAFINQTKFPRLLNAENIDRLTPNKTNRIKQAQNIVNTMPNIGTKFGLFNKQLLLSRKLLQSSSLYSPQVQLTYEQSSSSLTEPQHQQDESISKKSLIKIKNNLFLLNLQKIKYHKIGYFHCFNLENRNTIFFSKNQSPSSNKNSHAGQSSDCHSAVTLAPHKGHKIKNYLNFTNSKVLLAPISLKSEFTLRKSIALKRFKKLTYLLELVALINSSVSSNCGINTTAEWPSSNKSFLFSNSKFSNAFRQPEMSFYKNLVMGISQFEPSLVSGLNINNSYIQSVAPVVLDVFKVVEKKQNQKFSRPFRARSKRANVTAAGLKVTLARDPNKVQGFRVQSQINPGQPEPSSGLSPVGLSSSKSSKYSNTNSLSYTPYICNVWFTPNKKYKSHQTNLLTTNFNFSKALFVKTLRNLTVVKQVQTGLRPHLSIAQAPIRDVSSGLGLKPEPTKTLFLFGFRAGQSSGCHSAVTLARHKDSLKLQFTSLNNVFSEKQFSKLSKFILATKKIKKYKDFYKNYLNIVQVSVRGRAYRAKSNISPLTFSPRPKLFPTGSLSSARVQSKSFHTGHSEGRGPNYLIKNVPTKFSQNQQTSLPTLILKSWLKIKNYLLQDSNNISSVTSGLRPGSPLTSRQFTRVQSKSSHTGQSLGFPLAESNISPAALALVSSKPFINLITNVNKKTIFNSKLNTEPWYNYSKKNYIILNFNKNKLGKLNKIAKFTKYFLFESNRANISPRQPEQSSGQTFNSSDNIRLFSKYIEFNNPINALIFKEHKKRLCRANVTAAGLKVTLARDPNKVQGFRAQSKISRGHPERSSGLSPKPEVKTERQSKRSLKVQSLKSVTAQISSKASRARSNISSATDSGKPDREWGLELFPTLRLGKNKSETAGLRPSASIFYNKTQKLNIFEYVKQTQTQFGTQQILKHFKTQNFKQPQGNSKPLTILNSKQSNYKFWITKKALAQPLKIVPLRLCRANVTAAGLKVTLARDPNKVQGFRVQSQINPGQPEPEQSSGCHTALCSGLSPRPEVKTERQSKSSLKVPSLEFSTSSQTGHYWSKNNSFYHSLQLPEDKKLTRYLIPNTNLCYGFSSFIERKLNNKIIKYAISKYQLYIIKNKILIFNQFLKQVLAQRTKFYKKIKQKSSNLLQGSPWLVNQNNSFDKNQKVQNSVPNVNLNSVQVKDFLFLNKKFLITKKHVTSICNYFITKKINFILPKHNETDLNKPNVTDGHRASRAKSNISPSVTPALSQNSSSHTGQSSGCHSALALGPSNNIRPRSIKIDYILENLKNLKQCFVSYNFLSPIFNSKLKTKIKKSLYNSNSAQGDVLRKKNKTKSSTDAYRKQKPKQSLNSITTQLLKQGIQEIVYIFVKNNWLLRTLESLSSVKVNSDLHYQEKDINSINTNSSTQISKNYCSIWVYKTIINKFNTNNLEPFGAKSNISPISSRPLPSGSYSSAIVDTKGLSHLPSLFNKLTIYPGIFIIDNILFDKNAINPIFPISTKILSKITSQAMKKANYFDLFTNNVKNIKHLALYNSKFVNSRLSENTKPRPFTQGSLLEKSYLLNTKNLRQTFEIVPQFGTKYSVLFKKLIYPKLLCRANVTAAGLKVTLARDPNKVQGFRVQSQISPGQPERSSGLSPRPEVKTERHSSRYHTGHSLSKKLIAQDSSKNKAQHKQKPYDRLSLARVTTSLINQENLNDKAILPSSKLSKIQDLDRILKTEIFKQNFVWIKNKKPRFLPKHLEEKIKINNPEVSEGTKPNISSKPSPNGSLSSLLEQSSSSYMGQSLGAEAPSELCSGPNHTALNLDPNLNGFLLQNNTVNTFTHFSKYITKQSVITNLCYLLYLNQDSNINLDKKNNNLIFSNLLANKINLKYPAKILKMIKNQVKQTNHSKHIKHINSLMPSRVKSNISPITSRLSPFGSYSSAIVYSSAELPRSKRSSVTSGLRPEWPHPNLNSVQAPVRGEVQREQQLLQGSSESQMAYILLNKLPEIHVFPKIENKDMFFQKHFLKNLKNLNYRVKFSTQKLSAIPHSILYKQFNNSQILFNKKRLNNQLHKPFRQLFTYTKSLNKSLYNMKNSKQKRDLKLFPKIANSYFRLKKLTKSAFTSTGSSSSARIDNKNYPKNIISNKKDKQISTKTNVRTSVLKRFSKKTKTVSSIKTHNNLFFKHSISDDLGRTKKTFFDYQFRNPSYSFTLTAKTTNFKALYNNKIFEKGKISLAIIPKQPCLNICFSSNSLRTQGRRADVTFRPSVRSGLRPGSPLTSRSSKKRMAHKILQFTQKQNQQPEGASTTFFNNLEFFSNILAQTNYFSPFQGELLYTKPYKTYLELNPYKTLKTGLVQNKFIYPLSKYKLNKAYALEDTLALETDGHRAYRARSNISPETVSPSMIPDLRPSDNIRPKPSPDSSLNSPRVTKETKMRTAMFKYYFKNITKNVIPQGWSRFNLILTNKDLVALNYTEKTEKNITIFSEIILLQSSSSDSSTVIGPQKKYFSTIPQFSYSQAFLNKLFKNYVKNKMKIQTLSILNKENNFNQKYNFNLKNMWLKQLSTEAFYNTYRARCRRSDVTDGRRLDVTDGFKPEPTKTLFLFDSRSKQSSGCNSASGLAKVAVYKIKISLPYNAFIKPKKFKTEQTSKLVITNLTIQSLLYNGHRAYRARSNINLAPKGSLSSARVHSFYPRSKPKGKSSHTGQASGCHLAKTSFLSPGNFYYQNDFCCLQKSLYKKQQILSIVYLLLPYNCILNFKWFNFKQKKYITKNKVGFFLLKGNSFFNSSTKILNTFLKTYNFLNFKLYNLDYLTSLLQDSRYLDLNISLELQKLHLNLNFLQLKPFFDKTYFSYTYLFRPQKQNYTVQRREQSTEHSSRKDTLTALYSDSPGFKPEPTKTLFLPRMGAFAMQKFKEHAQFLPEVKTEGQSSGCHSAVTLAQYKTIKTFKTFKKQRYYTKLYKFIFHRPFAHIIGVESALMTLGHSKHTHANIKEPVFSSNQLLKFYGSLPLRVQSRRADLTDGRKPDPEWELELCPALCLGKTKSETNGLKGPFALQPSVTSGLRPGSPLTWRPSLSSDGFSSNSAPSGSLSSAEVKGSFSFALVDTLGLHKSIFNFLKLLDVNSSCYLQKEISFYQMLTVRQLKLSSSKSLFRESELWSVLFFKHISNGLKVALGLIFEHILLPDQSLCYHSALGLIRAIQRAKLVENPSPTNSFVNGRKSYRLEDTTATVNLSLSVTSGRWLSDLEWPLKPSKNTFGLENITNSQLRVIKKSGLLIHMNKQQITLRLGQPLVISPRSIIHATHGDFISYKKAVITLTYQQLKTGDIVQGIPKIEQLFEARTTKRGRLFRDNVSNLLTGLFLKYFVKSTVLLRKNLLDISKNLPLSQSKSSHYLQKNGFGLAPIRGRSSQFLNNKQNQTMILALALQWSVKQSFYKIQQIIVDGILRVYRSQGVSIADKHVEIIVKQMTSKVRIINSNASKMNDYLFNFKNINRNLSNNLLEQNKSSLTASKSVTISTNRVTSLKHNKENKLLEKLLSNNLDGPTGLFPGEIVDIDFVENINTFLLKTASLDSFQSSQSIAFVVEPIKYEPIVLGITRASLEVESFLSAASFQQTTKVLSQAALYKKKDFLKGLKENIIIGNLIPAGTGYLSSINL